MRVWLIKVGEPLPIDEGNDRPFRMGLIAESLLDRGHDVVWWSSTFNHAKRSLRADRDAVETLGNGLELRLIHSVPYRQNRSIRRLLNHVDTARKLANAAREVSPPDLVLSALPTPELCHVATRIGMSLGIPVIIDIRDLWPDIFLDLAPRRLRGLAKTMLAPYYRMTSAALRRATALVGTTPAYVQWGQTLAGRPSTDMDKAFPMGYPDRRPSDAEIEDAKRFWRTEHCLSEDAGLFVGCFLGAFSRQFDLDTVIYAARALQQEGARSIRLVLAGDGELLPVCRRLASGCELVVLPGWVSWPRLWTLMRMAAFGIAPYRSVDNFTMNIPNKPIEYLSASLPVVSSLKGQLEQMLGKHGCGVTYANRDAKGLAAAIGTLLNDPKHRSMMALRAGELFRSRFTAGEVYGGLCRHLEAIVDRVRAPHG